MGILDDLLEEEQNKKSSHNEAGILDDLLEEDTPQVHDTTLPEQQKYKNNDTLPERQRSSVPKSLETDWRGENIKSFMDWENPMKNFELDAKKEEQKDSDIWNDASLSFDEKMMKISERGRERTAQRKSEKIVKEEDKGLVEKFDSTPKEERTALKLSLSPDEQERIARYRDWNVHYNKEEGKSFNSSPEYKYKQLHQAHRNYVPNTSISQASDEAIKNAKYTAPNTEEQIKNTYGKVEVIERTNKADDMYISEIEKKGVNNLADWEKEFKKDNPAMGELYLAGKQFLLRDVPTNIFATGEAMTQGWGDGSVNDFFATGRDYWRAQKLRNPGENASEDIGSFVEGGWKDPRFYTRGVGQIIPQAGMSFALGVLAKNPMAGYASIFAQEGGGTYNEMLDRGISPDDAKVASLVHGAVATGLESINFGKYLGKIMGNKTSGDIIKNQSKTIENILKGSYKQQLKNVLKEGGIDMLKEAGTEGLQQLSQNVAMRWNDKNQDLFDGIIDSAVIGAIGGMGYTSIGASTNPILNKPLKDAYWTMKYNINEAVNRVNGITPVKSDIEYTMAQVMLNEYQNITETPALEYEQNGQKTSIKTVEYENGYSANLAVDNEGNGYISAHDSLYETKDDAIRGTIEDNAEQIEKIGVAPGSILKQYDKKIEAQKQGEKAMQEEIERTKPTDTSVADKTREFGTIKEIKKGLHFNEKMMNITKSARKETYMSGKSVFMEEMLSPINSALKKALKIKTNKVDQKDIQSIYTLDKLIDHPKLFAKYPFLKNQEVVFANFHTRKKRGLTGKGSIFLNTQIKNKNLLYSTLVHEIQHSIQDRTGKTQYDGLGVITNKDILESEARERQNEYLESVGEERLPAYGEKVQSYKSPKEEIYTTQFVGNEKPLRELTEAEKVFVENYKKLERGEIDKAVIAKGEVDGDGNKEDIYLGSGRDQKIKGSHGEYSIENLIISIHDADIILGNIEGASNKINYIKKLENDNSLVTSVQKKQGNYIITHFPVQENGKQYIQSLYERGAREIKNSPAFDHTDGSKKSRDTGKSDTIISKKENKANESVENYKSTGESVGIANIQKSRENLLLKKAEEFDHINLFIADYFKGSNILHHGGPSELVGGKLDTKRGHRNAVFLAENTIEGKKYAQGYTKGHIGGKLYQFELDKNAKIFSIRNKKDKSILRNSVPENTYSYITERLKRGKELYWEDLLPEYMSIIKDLGYDGVRVLEREKGHEVKGVHGMYKTIEDINSIAIFNTGKLYITKTEKQLEKIYQEAHRSGKSNVENLKSTSESTGISQSEKRGESTKTEAFKLSERIKQIIKNLDTNYTRYVAPGSKGTFYTETGNVALQSINDIDTVHHELSHLIDTKEQISDQYQNDETIMGELEKIYLEYYPGADKSHHPDTKMREGYAVLQQYHLMSPSVIEASYPELVDTFIKNGSKLQKELNKDMNALLEEYQNLSDTEKIGSILSDETHNNEAKSFLNPTEKIERYSSDVVLPFVKLEEQAKSSPIASSLMYGSKTMNGRIYKNIEPSNKDFWHFNKKRELEKKYDYNWGSLVREIGKNGDIDGFTEWLVARDQVGQYERLDRLNRRIKSTPDGKKKDEMVVRRDEIVAYLKGNEKILPRKLVENVHQKGKKKYKQYAEKFDSLLDLDVDFLHSTGILSDEHYNAIKNSYGYAPLRRVMDDGIVGSNNTNIQIAGFKIPKAKQIKGRDGGTADIFNPLLGAIENHVEAMQKGYRQMTLNTVYDLMKNFPEYAQIFDPIVTIIEGKPKYTTPQGKELAMDENIIIKMVQGKPKPMVLNGELIETIEAVFHPAEQKKLERIIISANQLFTKGTTGTFVPFALTNFIRDQWTAVAHSKNGYIPIYSQLRELLPIIWNRKGKRAQYMREYISLGSHQNRFKWNEATGPEILKYLAEDEKVWKKTLNMINKGIDILAIPSNLSETGTRIVEYIQSREAGKSMWESLEDAGQLTAPFHHQGKVMDSGGGRLILRSVPFFSATIQGVSQWLRTVRTPQGRKQAGLVFASANMFIVASILYMWATTDEDTKQAILDMDPSQFGRYIFIPKSNGEYIRIAIPQELGGIGASIGMMINDGYGAGYSANDYMDVMTSWLPDQVNLTKPQRAAIALTPTILKPTMEIAFNRKTFPDVMPIESMSMQRLPSQFRYHSNTSVLAKWLGATSIARSAELSPIKIDHWLTGTLGRASGYATGKNTAINPFTALTAKRYFTSGRMIQKMYDEKEYVANLLTAKNKGLLPGSDEEIIELRKKKEVINSIADNITEYIVAQKKGESPEKLKEMRIDLWNKSSNYFENGVEITKVDIMKYEKYKESKKWNEDKIKILKSALENYKKDTRMMKGSIQEQKIKEQMGGSKMNSTQKRRYTTLIKEFRLQSKYGDNEDVMQIFEGKNNDEKALLFDKYREKVGDEEYKKVRDHLRKLNIISRDLYKKLRD